MQRKLKKPEKPNPVVSQKEPTGLSKFLTFCNEHKALIFILFLILSGGILIYGLANKSKENNYKGPAAPPKIPEIETPKPLLPLTPLSVLRAPRITNPTQKLRFKVKECEEFALVAGDPETATTFILGETHNQHNKTIACMDSILNAKNISKHTVGVEFVPQGDKFQCSEKDIPDQPGRTCVGWDNEKLMLKLYNYNISYNLRLALKQEFYSKKISDAQFDEILKIDLRKRLNRLALTVPEKQFENPTLRGYTQEKFNTVFKIIEYRALKKILADRQNNKSYAHIFAELPAKGTHVLGQPNAEYIADSLERNKNLIATATHQDGSFKVIITGKAHVSKTGLFKGEFDQGAQEVTNALEKNKDANPYAILAYIHNQ